MVGFTVDKESGDGKRVYRYRMESYRDDTGKERHRQEYLGRVVKKPGGSEVLIPRKSRERNVEEVLPFGDLALLYDCAHTLGMVETIDRLAPRAAGTPVGPALLVLALNHLVGRVALDDVADWHQRSMLRYWLPLRPEELGEHRLLSVLDQVCHQDEEILRDKTWLISHALHERLAQAYGPPEGVLYYDRTQIVYVGDVCEWAEFGHDEDASPDRRKVGMGLVVAGGTGFPVLYRTYRGNQVDVTTMKVIRDRLTRMGLQAPQVVVDRGCASDANVKAMMDAGFRIILGVPANWDEYAGVVDALGDDEVERAEHRIVRTGRVVFAVQRRLRGKPGKFVCYQDPKVRGSLKRGLMDAVGEREKALVELAKTLKEEATRSPPPRRRPVAERVREILGGLKKCFEWSHDAKGLAWRVKTEEVDGRLRRLARVVLHVTDASVPAAQAVHAYLDKDEIEKAFRVAKSDIALSAIKHVKRDRVVAYLFVEYLAYLLRAVVSHRLKQADIDVTPEKALAALRRVQMVRLVRENEEFLEPPPPIALEKELCEKLDLLKWRQVGV